MKKPVSRKDKLRDKREQKIEQVRYMALDEVCRMHMPDSRFRSVRQIASFYGYSHTWLYDLMDVCLDWHYETVIEGFRWERGRERAVYRKIRVYTMKPDVRKRIKRRDRGPQKGYLSLRTELSADAIVAVKKQHPELGAAKISKMACSPVSAPTARKILYLAGYPPVTMRRGRKYRRFEKEYVNEMWQIDYVQIGWDSVTGRAVESLSVIDDHSRMMLTADAGITATTDDVIRILEEAIGVYGKPHAILSDHGTQWCSSNGGSTRFDEWCGRNGIEHLMGGVRKPTTQGKVERYHGSLKREAGLLATGTLEEYLAVIRRYVRFYNEERPHWALGLETPLKVFTEHAKYPGTATA